MSFLRNYFKLGSISYVELGKRVVHEISEDGCSVYAAAMAYYLLFALFPFFLFLTTLIGYLPFPNLPEFILDTMKRFLPEQAFTLLQDNIRTLFSNKKGGLLSLGMSCLVDFFNRHHLHHGGNEPPVCRERGTAVLEGETDSYPPGGGSLGAIHPGAGSPHVRAEDRRLYCQYHPFRAGFRNRLEHCTGPCDSVHVGAGSGTDLLLYTGCGPEMEMDQSRFCRFHSSLDSGVSCLFLLHQQLQFVPTKPTAVSGR